MATSNTPKASAAAAVTKTTAKFVGHVGTLRIITKEDQDRLTGVSGVAKEDLIWNPGNPTIDVTDVDEAVLDYLKSDEEFKLRTLTVEAPAEEAKA